MFYFLEFISTMILFVGIVLIFGRKLKRSRTYVTGLSIVLVIASFCSGIVMYAIPMPTETVRIEATGYKNYMSEGTALGIKGVVVDGKEYPIGTPVEGTWFYSEEDEAYLWLDESDERWTESITKDITFEVPMGGGRRLVFLSGNNFGLARVFCGKENAAHDLYKNSETVSNQKIPFFDSDPIRDNLIKLCRLGIYNLLVLAILALAVWLVQRIDKESLNKLIYGILSLVTALTFFLDVTLTTRSGYDLFALCYDFNRSFSGNFVLGIILFPMLYKTFVYCGGIYRKKYSSVRDTFCIALPAGVFAIFMVLGDAFINGSDTLKPIFENDLQFLKSLFAVAGYFSVFFFGITWIFNYLDCMDIYEVATKKHFRPVQLYLDSLRARPFVTTFVTLLVGYTPLLIISYPGLLMRDSVDSMDQIYGTMKFNNTHPIIYTRFLGLCMKIGGLLFNSSNAGMFINSILQFFFSILVVSLLVKSLIEIGISNKIALFLIVYYLFHPKIQNYFILLTKDVINSVFLLSFVASLYMLLTKKRSKYMYILLGISDLGMLIFRNESFYVMILSLMLLFFLVRDFRKQSAAILVCTIIFMGLWKTLMLPILGVSSAKGSMSSNPTSGDISTALKFVETMQTARYIRDAKNEVTDGEKEIISAYLDYDRIVKAYRPSDKADSAIRLIKSSTITRDDVMAYHKTWLKMFVKHPEIYLEGMLNFKYYYLYPGRLPNSYSYSWSTSMMALVNESNLDRMPSKLSYPSETARLRNRYESLRESFFSIPIFNLLFTSASFFWVLLTWFFYSAHRKNIISVSIMVPLLCQIAALILGPTNGRYFRYTYLYVYCLPFVIVFGLHCVKQQGAMCRNKNLQREK